MRPVTPLLSESAPADCGADDADGDDDADDDDDDDADAIASDVDAAAAAAAGDAESRALADMGECVARAAEDDARQSSERDNAS